MDIKDKILTYIETITLPIGASFSDKAQLKIFEEAAHEPPLVLNGEDAFKLVASEEALEGFVDLFDDPTEYYIETQRLDLKPGVLLLMEDAFSYVEEN